MANTETTQVKAWISNRSGIVSQIFTETDGTFGTYWAGTRIAISTDLAAAIRTVMQRTPVWDLTQLTTR